MRNILIAPDKFKGSLSARQVCEAIASGLKQSGEPLDISFHPMADGGDGSLAILAEHLSLEEETVSTQDPLGRPLTATYFMADEAAFIEVASASGLVLLEEHERNPLYTSTLGTGEMLLDAIAKGYQHIYLFLGGSATNDAGMGIAQALGFQFLDAGNNVLQPIGNNLSKVSRIHNLERIDFSQIKITLFCDVDNPLSGSNGAAYVYAPQKGATATQVAYLDLGLAHFGQLLEKQSGLAVSALSGSGAAGGIGAGLVALCKARMEKGFELISELTQLEEKIQAADWVISGEGKLDEQSLQGKVVDGMARLCQKHQKPLTLFVGKNDLTEKALPVLNINAVLSITDLAIDTKDAILNGGHYLEILAERFRFF